MTSPAYQHSEGAARMPGKTPPSTTFRELDADDVIAAYEEAAHRRGWVIGPSTGTTWVSAPHAGVLQDALDDLSVYHGALERGLSDYEAREEAWPVQVEKDSWSAVAGEVMAPFYEAENTASQPPEENHP